jgi:hypothetical protein
MEYRIAVSTCFYVLPGLALGIITSLYFLHIYWAVRLVFAVIRLSGVMVCAGGRAGERRDVVIQFPVLIFSVSKRR